MDQNDFFVDSTSETRYNSNNDEYVDVIKMDEQRPLNDTTCQHDTLVADDNDTIGDATLHMCANVKCGVGFYIKNKTLARAFIALMEY
jgi:hypothetical protein